MKKYTHEEKLNLLNAINVYINGYEWARNLRTNKEREREFPKIEDLRIKLILDIAPITTEELEPSNADYIKCCLCRNTDVLQYPEMRGIISGFGYICNKCFSEHNPDLYKIACKETKKLKKEVEEYYVKEYTDRFNPDGTFKPHEVKSTLPGLPGF
jgi:hypothetical protein